MGPFMAVPDDLYHMDVIRTTLTRQLGALSADLYDETQLAFADIIPPTDGKPEFSVYRNLLILLIKRYRVVRRNTYEERRRNSGEGQLSCICRSARL